MFTPETTAVTLAQSCRMAGLDPAGARLMRLGTNAVYRLTSPVVVRIARADRLSEMKRTVAVARWLASVGYPAVRALRVDQPVVIDGCASTFWEALPDGDTYASTGQVARVLVHLHSMCSPDGLDLPEFDPLGPIARRLDSGTWLSVDDRTLLTERLELLRGRYAELDFVLPRGVIHGDANVGNVLVDGDGQPVVIDLDSFAVGAREWDLIQTAIFYDRFGWHSQEEYRSFVEVYGFDIMQWPGYPVLRDIRELHMVSWLIQNASGRERVAAEARKRIDSLRTDGSRRDWKPY
ncbi:MAG: phosphotransferase enzyme family protein [Streptosporangiaceae bacterium]